MTAVDEHRRGGADAIALQTLALPEPAKPGVVSEAERRWASKPILVLADTAAMTVALAVASWTQTSLREPIAGDPRRVAFLALASLPFWSVFFARRRLYNARFVTRHLDEFRRIVSGVALGVVALTVAAYAFKIFAPRGWLFLVFAIGVGIVTLEREIARSAFGRLRRRGRLLRRVIIIGTNLEGLEISRMLATDARLGYQVVGFVDDDPTAPLEVRGISTLGGTADTARVVKSTGASGVVIAATAMELGTSNRLIRELTDAGIHVELSSTLRDIAADRLTVHPLGRFPVVYVEPVQRHGWRSGAKRVFDVVITCAAGLLVLPVVGICAIAIKVSSPGPILFRQERVGRAGKRFSVVKLRTMVIGAEAKMDELRTQNEADGPLFKMRSDPRVTAVGSFLRRSSLDELPQLWNVLRGEMSLVGPRPALPGEMDGWGDDLHQRLRVQPGITGMWQVSGRSSASFEDYERLDLYYVDNWSLVSDLTILLKTVPSVLFRCGAY